MKPFSAWTAWANVLTSRERDDTISRCGSTSVKARMG